MSTLEEENNQLRFRVASLEKEVEYLKTHPTLAQGIKGESLIARIAAGRITKYAESYDLMVGNNVRVEVKFSKLNTPVPGRATRRWNWSKPLGWKDKGKDFDFLLLVGDKDIRFPEQYLDDAPYIYFLVPRTRIKSIMNSGAAIGANVQIVTNLKGAKSPTSMALKEHIVSETTISELLRGAIQK